MKQLKYSLTLEGHSNLLNPAGQLNRMGESEDTPFTADVSGQAAYDKITILEGADHIAYILQSSLHNVVTFEGQITPTDAATFQETGRIQFGDGQHVLHFSTVGHGHLLTSPAADWRQGAVTLQVEGGTGLFEEATGVITANFLVSETGDYRDVHTATLFLRGDESAEQTQPQHRMHVRDVIDEKAFPITADATMEYVADLLALTEDSELMVIDADGCFAGVVSETDLLRAVIPDVDEIVKGGGSLNDACHIFIQSGQDLAGQPVRRLVKNNPRTVAPDDELLAVATVMLQSDKRRVPVVEDDLFIGSVSLADICWAVLSKWNGIRQQ